MIRYKCEECGAALNIKDELAGTTGHCPRCKGEFVVPSPEEAAAREAAAPASKAAAEAGGEAPAAAGDLSEDEIEMILEGKAAAEGDYRVAVADDEGDDDGDAGRSPAGRTRAARVEEESDDEEDEEELARRRRREKTPAPAPAVSSAGIARELMARGEKGAKAEVEERRAGRPFGGGDRDDEEAEGHSPAEIAAYLGKFALPVIVVAGMIWGYYAWWYSAWKRGDLPELGTVQGTVTLDGSPLAGATVEFHPIHEGNQIALKLSSSIGMTDQDGRYTLFYINNVPGAVAGKHIVRIKDLSTGIEKLPEQYNAKSTLGAEVTSGSQTLDFPLVSQPPEMQQNK